MSTDVALAQISETAFIVCDHGKPARNVFTNSLQEREARLFNRLVPEDGDQSKQDPFRLKLPPDPGPWGKRSRAAVLLGDSLDARRVLPYDGVYDS